MGVHLAVKGCPLTTNVHDTSWLRVDRAPTITVLAIPFRLIQYVTVALLADLDLVPILVSSEVTSHL
jgi:hypothetical protein